jgi:hypothetical protein
MQETKQYDLDFFNKFLDQEQKKFQLLKKKHDILHIGDKTSYFPPIYDFKTFSNLQSSLQVSLLISFILSKILWLTNFHLIQYYYLIVVSLN